MPSLTDYYLTNIILDWAFEQLQQEKRIAVLEAQVTGFSRVADETTRNTQRIDGMHDTLVRFTGTLVKLENVLDRICLDDRRLPVAPLRLEAPTPSPVMVLPTSPSAPPADAMDEDETDSAVGSITFPETHTTASESADDIRMVDAPIHLPHAQSLAADPAPVEAMSDPSPAIVDVAGMSLNLIPPTPQGSQENNTAPTRSKTPVGKEGDSVPLGRPNTRSRSVSRAPN